MKLFTVLQLVGHTDRSFGAIIAIQSILPPAAAFRNNLLAILEVDDFHAGRFVALLHDENLFS